jgi:hypothetical protein
MLDQERIKKYMCFAKMTAPLNNGVPIAMPHSLP